jgi:hypothetical protein
MPKTDKFQAAYTEKRGPAQKKTNHTPTPTLGKKVQQQFVAKVQKHEGIFPVEKDFGNGYTGKQIGDKKNPKSPVGPYFQIKNTLVNSNDPGYTNRLLVATPTTGLIRMEWALARWGCIIPTNWSQVQMVQWLSTYAPIQYLIADAQNMIIKEAIEKNYEWVFLWEHDVIPQPDAMLRLNDHIRSEKNPIVSGLYYTKSVPAEPMIYRGRGNSYFTDWEFGDEVYTDGVPTGFLLIHSSILRAMWDESPEYIVNGQKTRRVFNTPRDMWNDPITGQVNSTTGTSDLDWCTRVMEGKYFEKAGWKKHQKMRYPFLIDTAIFCKQIDENGVQYP